MSFLNRSKGIIQSFLLFYLLDWLFLEGMKFYGMPVTSQIMTIVALFLFGALVALTGAKLKRKGR